MDVSVCKAIVDNHFPALRELLCLGHWEITPKYNSLPDGIAAQCWPEVSYDRANIIFDAAKYETEEQIIDLIVHELAHLIGAPFDLLFEAASPYFREDPSATDSLRRVNIHASEQHVINIERIWRKHLARVYYESVTRPD